MQSRHPLGVCAALVLCGMVRLGGPSGWAQTITGENIVNGSIGTVDLANEAVTGAKLARDAVGTGRLQDEAVTAAKIAPGAINATKLTPSLLARITALETKLAALMPLQALLALSSHLHVVEGPLDGLAGPHLVFSGINVHLQSGSGFTGDRGEPTGLGNLVIGYNEAPPGFAAGERAGAHNLIVGRHHRYTSVGGLVAGEGNTLSGALASITGGQENIASGRLASISGGAGNTASGRLASVSGGTGHTAAGVMALQPLSTSLTDGLDTVRAEFAAADTALHTSLTTAYQAADTTLNTALTAAYQAADTALGTSLTAAYQAADTTLTTAYQAADTTLTTTLTGVDTRLQTVEADPAFDLSTYVQVVEGIVNGLAGPHVIFTGANVHIRSGSTATDDNGTLTGRGNLIVGYNEGSPPSDRVA